MPDVSALRNAALRAFDLVASTTSVRLALAHVELVGGRESIPKRFHKYIGEIPKSLSKKDVEKLLSDAWGEKSSKVLDSLDGDPAAVTMTSQVHKGVYEGEQVAIKIRRPGLVEVVRADLALAEQVAGVISGVAPSLPLSAHVREIRDRILSELDLEDETDAMRRAGRALRRADGIAIPKPVSDLAREDVLVCSWQSGEPVRSKLGSGDAALAEQILRVFISLANVGLVHCDPNPDDILIGKRGLALLDWGACVAVPEERIELLKRGLKAFATSDGAGLAAILDEAGWIPGADGELGERLVAMAEDVAGPYIHGITPITVDAGLDIAKKVFDDYGSLVMDLAQRVAVPAADLTPLRSVGQLAALLARLEVQLDVQAIVLDALDA